jgi:uncharacterized membrane-anchored protein
MTALIKGLVIGAIQVAIVSSLGVKLLVDRNTRPRVWVRTAPVDPDLPIRGRYVRLRIEAQASSDFRSASGVATPGGLPWNRVSVLLSERNGHLVATPDRTNWSNVRAQPTARVDEKGEPLVLLYEPVAYFIPEHATDPSVRSPGEELWVEVTVPRAGLPRPIRLGVKKDGMITPIEG